jgi:hypothetical protein
MRGLFCARVVIYGDVAAGVFSLPVSRPSVATSVEKRREALHSLQVPELLPLGDAVPPELRFE